MVGSRGNGSTLPTNSGPASPDPAQPDPPSDTGRRRTLYGRRLGRPLKQGRESALAEWLPKLTVAVPEHGRLDPARLFSHALDDLWLEVGFGSGEHLLAQAAAHPRTGIIGCEPFINGMAALLAEIAREPARAANVRVLMDDARPLIAALPDAALGRAFVLFPDPWPKSRHHKRRFIGPENLVELARVLKDGAELRVASDHAAYVDWTLEHLSGHPAFTLIRPESEWHERPADWPETRYEAKARAQGRAPVFLAFRRRPR
jgi:tRNA (guanine-N7-)-methyltransferase